MSTKKILAVVLTLALFLNNLPLTTARSPNTISISKAKINSSVIKNGETLEVSARVKSATAIKTGFAQIEGIKETIDLQKIEGTLTDGVWSGKWKAENLRPQNYQVKLIFSDAAGNVKTDESLQFSDPIVGNNTIGNAETLKRVDEVEGLLTDSDFQRSVVDKTRGFVYWAGLNGGATTIVKTDINGSTPTRVGEYRITGSGSAWGCAVIDEANNIGYFISNSGRVLKIDLATMTRIDGIALGNSSSFGCQTMVMDSTASFAYAGLINNQIARIDLNNFDISGVDFITVSGQSMSMEASVINSTDTFAYFANGASTTTIGIIHEIDLNTFTETNSLTLNSGETRPISAVIDSTDTFAYFGMETNPGKIVKVQLSPLSRIDVVTFLVNEAIPYGAVIDNTDTSLYFGTNSNPSKVVKVDVATFTRTGALTMGTLNGEADIHTGVIDAAGTTAYFGTGTQPATATYPANIIKVNLTTPLPTKTSTTTSQIGDTFATYAIDSTGDIAYFGTSNGFGISDTAEVIKVDLSTSPATILERLYLNPGEGSISAAVIDSSDQFIYFGLSSNTLGNPGRVVKVDISGPTMSRVGVLNLSGVERGFVGGVIDDSGTNIYFATNAFDGSTPSRIVKIDLGTFTRSGALSLNSGETSVGTLLKDPNGDFAYTSSSSNFIKIDLSTALPTRDSDTPVPAETSGGSAGIFSSTGDLYIGTSGTLSSPSKIVKLDVSGPITYIGSISLDPGEGTVNAATYDSLFNRGYFYVESPISTGFDIAKIISVDLSGTLPVREGYIKMDTSEVFPGTALQDTNGHFFFGVDNAGLRSLVNFDRNLLPNKTHGYEITLPVTATSVSGFRFFTKGGTTPSLLKLGLYNSSKTLIWESGIINNAQNNRWLYSAVSGGTPSTLTNLAPGTYYLAFQTTSYPYIARETRGTTGDGFEFNSGFGSLSSPIVGETPTPFNWSYYMLYQSSAPVVATATSGSFDITSPTTPPSTPPSPGNGGSGSGSGSGPGNPGVPVPPATPPSDDDNGSTPSTPTTPSTPGSTGGDDDTGSTGSGSTPSNPTPPSTPSNPAPGTTPTNPVTVPTIPSSNPSQENPDSPLFGTGTGTSPLFNQTQTSTPNQPGNGGGACRNGVWNNINVYDGIQDTDGDGVSDRLECEYKSDPTKADTDDDGINDNVEIFDFNSDVANPEDPFREKITDLNKELQNYLNALGVRITNFTQNQRIADTTPFVKGIAPIGSNVTISIRNEEGLEQALGQTTTSENGIFLFETPITLRDGHYYLIARSNSLTSPAVSIYIDSTLGIKPPILKQIADKPITSDVLLKNLRIEIRNRKPVLIGTTDLGNKVVANWNSIVSTSAIIADVNAGNFELSSPNEMELGEHHVYVTAIRHSDNAQSETVKLPFTITQDDFLDESSYWWMIGAVTIAIAGTLIIIVKKKRKKDEQEKIAA